MNSRHDRADSYSCTSNRDGAMNVSPLHLENEDRSFSVTYLQETIILITSEQSIDGRQKSEEVKITRRGRLARRSLESSSEHVEIGAAGRCLLLWFLHWGQRSEDVELVARRNGRFGLR